MLIRIPNFSVLVLLLTGFLAVSGTGLPAQSAPAPSGFDELFPIAAPAGESALSIDGLFAKELFEDGDLSEMGFADSDDKRPDPTEGFLLRVHEVLQYPQGNGEVLAFFFRDGLIVLFNTTPEGQLTVFRSRYGSVEHIQAELTRARIGMQQGDCDLPWSLAPGFDLPAGSISRVSTLSWFGNHDRSRHLRFGYGNGANNFGNACNDELRRLTNQVQDEIQRLFDPPVTPPALIRADRDVLYVVNNSFQEDPDCGDDGFVDDYFVFRDGLVLRNAQTYQGGYALMRGQATETALHELNRALADHRVGFQGGKCMVWFFQPFTIGGGCNEYTWQSGATWYGANDRRSTLFGSDDAERRCGFDQKEIAGAVTQFLRNTSAQDRTHHATGILPPL